MKKTKRLHAAVAANFSLTDESRKSLVYRGSKEELSVDAPIAAFCGVAISLHGSSFEDLAEFLGTDANTVKAFVYKFNSLTDSPDFQRKLGLVRNAMHMHDLEQQL